MTVSDKASFLAWRGDTKVARNCLAAWRLVVIDDKLAASAERAAREESSTSAAASAGGSPKRGSPEGKIQGKQSRGGQGEGIAADLEQQLVFERESKCELMATLAKYEAECESLRGNVSKLQSEAVEARSAARTAAAQATSPTISKQQQTTPQPQQTRPAGAGRAGAGDGISNRQRRKGALTAVIGVAVAASAFFWIKFGRSSHRIKA
jgi:hypothetical protein